MLRQIVPHCGCGLREQAISEDEVDAVLLAVT